jgi:two-component system, OmpR family, sensor histidine kinase KdpD
MSRLETGMLKPKFDWYDINELINSIIQKLDESDAQKIIFEQNESLPLFKFDRGLIEAVLQNLVHNAINYTPNSSSIKIEVLNDSANCYIHVIDNGKGIPESEINFLFDKFYRLPDTKTGGSGLGLSIVKGFVEAHNGKVKVKNNTLGGATFTLLLPIESTYINKLKNE